MVLRASHRMRVLVHFTFDFHTGRTGHKGPELDSSEAGIEFVFECICESVPAGVGILGHSDSEFKNSARYI